MTTNPINTNQIIKFPNTPSIDISLGLKHCNNNKALYFKILNNFVTRYQAINLKDIQAEELKRTLHSLKGLSATLGMVKLTNILSELENSYETTKINAFSLELQQITQSILNI